MRIGLISILGNVGSTQNSQGGAYGLIATRMIRDIYPNDEVVANPPSSDWDNFDFLYICEGVNFVPGSYNIMGGPQPNHYEKIEAISRFKGSKIN